MLSDVIIQNVNAYTNFASGPRKQYGFDVSFKQLNTHTDTDVARVIVQPILELTPPDERAAHGGAAVLVVGLQSRQDVALMNHDVDQ